MKKIKIPITCIVLLIASCSKELSPRISGSLFGTNQFFEGERYVVLCAYEITHKGKKNHYVFYPLVIQAGNNKDNYFVKLDNDLLLIGDQKSYPARSDYGKVIYFDSDTKNIYELQNVTWSEKMLAGNNDFIDEKIMLLLQNALNELEKKGSGR